jgi:hypothetical protein
MAPVAVTRKGEPVPVPLAAATTIVAIAMFLMSLINNTISRIALLVNEAYASSFLIISLHPHALFATNCGNTAIGISTILDYRALIPSNLES